MSTLTLFDLDQTLIREDSDTEWTHFLIDQGVLPKEATLKKINLYMKQYVEGRLDILEYLTFQLRPFALFPRPQLESWRAQFFRERILPIITEKAKELVRTELKKSDYTAIITATNTFVAEPIAQAFGIPYLIATQLQEKKGVFTGQPRGTPCFREGKITNLNAWLKKRKLKWEDFSLTRFYSDSQNDIPLMSRVTEPVAVDPDPVLLKHAQTKKWPIISLAD